MESRIARTCRRLTVAALLAGAWALPASAAEPAGPTSKPAAGAGTKPAAAGRSVEEIANELQATGNALSEAMPSPDALFDAAKRPAVAEKALPLLKKMIALFDEMSAANPEIKPRLARVKLELTGMRALLGDAEADAALHKLAASTDASEATGAAAWQAVTDFAHANNDPKAQQKVVAGLHELAKLHPTDDTITQVVDMLSQQAANDEVRDQAEKIATDDLKGPMAQQLAAELVGRRKLRALENKPLVIEGVKVDNAKLSTAAWKGKVILVDFWATWCGPCLGELPRVTKAYAQYHDKGLEVLGVSSDNDAEDLKSFLAEHKEMPWPQLFDVHKPGWSELAKGFGIESIPTMFLIDRKGVVRTVKARENFEELIPKLLEEKAE